MSKLAIVGSRTYSEFDAMKQLEDIADDGCYQLQDKYDTLVSGGARGADKAAELLAKEYPREFKLEIFYPDWELHGKSAGFKRNQQIADAADACVAFWDGESKGTIHTVNLFIKQGKPVTLIVNGRVAI